MGKSISRPPTKWQIFIAETEVNGTPKVAAYDIAFPDEVERSDQSKLSTIKKFMASDLYISLRDATMVGIGNTLQRKAEEAAEKMLDTYEDLLEQGSETIKEAKDTAEKISAMHAQRENLGVANNPLAVIASVAGDNRNKQLPEESSVKADAVILGRNFHQGDS